MRQKILRLSVILIILVAGFLTTNPAAAEEQLTSVFISEINWAGSVNSQADEWLELFNSTEGEISLAGWTIEGAATGNEILVLPDEAVIGPGTTYLIANYADDVSTINTPASFITTALSLSNSQSLLVLRDGSGAEIARVGDGGPPSAGSSGAGGLDWTASMFLTATGWQTTEVSEGFDVGIVQFGTPGLHSFEDEVISEETETETATENETPESESEMMTEGEENQQVPMAHDEQSLSEQETQEEETLLEPVAEELATVDLLLSEIMSAPIDGSEWVEIIAAGSGTMDLTGWFVREGGGGQKPLAGYLEAGRLVIVEFTNRLNNTGDLIELINPDGLTVDTISYGDWPGAAITAPEKGWTIAKDKEGNWTVTSEPTPTDTNSIVKPQIVPPAASSSPSSNSDQTKNEEKDEELKTMDLRLVEIMANPVGDDAAGEYLVIENVGEELADLTDWKIEDAQRSYTLSGGLPAGFRLTVPRLKSKLALNNDTDVVSLIAPNGFTVDSYVYAKIKEGEKLERTADGWSVASVDHAPQSSDVPSDSSQSETKPSISSAAIISATAEKPVVKKTSKASDVKRTIEEAVIAPPGLFDRRTMYVNGLQIYQNDGDFPELSIGDFIRVTGAIGLAYGEKRLKITDQKAIQILGHQETEPEPVNWSNLTEQVGRLVRVEGSILEDAGDRLILTQNDEELSVVLKKNVALSSSEIAVGSRYAIVGVLTSYNGTIRLLPRSESDIIALNQSLIEAEPPMGEANMIVRKNGVRFTGYVLVVGIILTLLILIWRTRRRSHLTSTTYGKTKKSTDGRMVQFAHDRT